MKNVKTPPLWTTFSNDPLDPLKAVHSTLLKQHREASDTKVLLNNAETFIRQGRAAGALLPRDMDRWNLQSILDYWVAILHRSGRIPPDATLVELDEEHVPKFCDEECPYVGITTFSETNQTQFFGRQRLLDELVTKVEQYPLVAVVGPSGSGASSLVFAGLLPKLSKGDEILGSQGWHRYPTVVPGSNPLKSLVQSLLSTCEKPTNAAAKAFQEQVHALENEPDQIIQLLQETTNGEQPTVLIIDQFEEAFTLCAQEAVRNTFIKVLVALIQSSEVQVKLILTMRTAYRGRIARLQSDPFKHHFDQGLVLIRPPEDDELREMIWEPAKTIGLHIEPELVDELIADIRGEPSAIYLLQDTLLRLWKLREYDWMTLNAYRQLGGAKYALVQGAQKAYEELSETEQRIARALLLRLVQVGIDRDAVSRRVLRSELLQNHAYQASEAATVLEKLTRARVVRQSRTDSPSDTQVELIHETLIQNWAALKTWLWDDWETLRQRQRLTDKAQLWEESRHSRSLLLQGGHLETAQEITDLAPLERAYVGASKQAKILADTRERRIYQGVIAALSTVVLVIALLAILAWNSEQAAVQARDEAQEAEHLALQARSEERKAKNLANVRLAVLLSSEAEQAVSSKPQLGLLLGVEGVSLLPASADSTAVTRTLRTLYHVLTETAGIPLSGTMGVITNVAELAVSPNGEWAAVGAEDGWVHLWRMQAEAPDLWFSNRIHAARVTALTFDPASEWLATGGQDATVSLFDLTVPAMELKDPASIALGAENSQVTTLAFHPQAQWLAVGNAAGYAQRVDVSAAGTLSATLLLSDNESKRLTTLAFSPDGTWLATVNISDSLRLWPLTPDLEMPLTESELLGEGKNGLLAFSPIASNRDRQWLAVGGQTADIVYLYNLSEPSDPRLELKGHHGGVGAIGFSPDNRQLAIGSGDGIVRLWELYDLAFWLPEEDQGSGAFDQSKPVIPELEPEALFALDGQISDLAFITTGVDSREIPGQLWMAVTDNNGVIGYWDIRHNLEPEGILRGHDNAVTALYFGPTSHILLSQSLDSTARIWDMNQERAPDDWSQLLDKQELDKWQTIAYQRAGRNFSQEERCQFFVDPNIGRSSPCD